MRRLEHGVWVTEINGDDGAKFAIADHGAHVLSWIPAGGDEAFYLSGRSGYGSGAAIRGGVPIIFPQFGERGSGRRHGFARTAAWRLEFTGIEQGRAVARYVLTDADVPAGTWQHRFALGYEVSALGEELCMSLTVSNPSAESWQFHAALHSYWRIADIDRVRVSGLRDLRYIDQVAQGVERMQGEEILRIEGEIDRIYGAIPGNIELNDGERRISLAQQGFADAVVWNPGAKKVAAISDLAAGDHRSFLCVETGAILRPVELAPGATWHGSQIVRLSRV